MGKQHVYISLLRLDYSAKKKENLKQRQLVWVLLAHTLDFYRVSLIFQES